MDRWRHQQLTSQVLSWVERNNNAKNEQEKIYGFGTQPPLALTIGEHFVSIVYTSLVVKCYANDVIVWLMLCCIYI